MTFESFPACNSYPSGPSLALDCIAHSAGAFKGAGDSRLARRTLAGEQGTYIVA